MGPSVVHGRAGQPRGLAGRRELRDRDARGAERAAGGGGVRLFRELDAQERVGDGRGGGGGGASLARPAGGKHAPRVAAHGHADARGADGRNRKLAEEGGHVGWDRVWRYEPDRAVGRNARGTKRVVRRLGA